MRRLGFGLLALTLLLAGCGRYGPPARTLAPEASPAASSSQSEEEPEERDDHELR
jgi:predicted small lipoprotein YifL